MPGLEGVPVLITRPEPQASAWARILSEQGAQPLPVPMMELRALTEPNDIQAIKNCVLDYDLYQNAVFVSQNAAAYALDWLDNYWPQLPLGIRYFAVGERTARALRDRGIEVTALQRDGAMDSEALLEAPELQSNSVANQRIVIFRGQGGRGLMGQELTQRGALVSYCELYRRCLPDNAAERLDSALAGAGNWRQELLVAVHSGETLDNYKTVLDQISHRALAEELLHRPLVVPGRRVSQRARELGFTRVITAGNATDTSMLAALKADHP